MKNFLNSLAFLTIIKLPEGYYFKKGFSRTLIYFPLTGFLIGIFLILFFALFDLIFPALLVSVMTVGFEAVITGGMHYDGLSDVFDGIFSGRSGENVYKIMKKSDIGTFGVLAILFSIILKTGFIYYIYALENNNLLIFYIFLLFMPGFGKWSMVYLLSFYSPVKEKSLSGLFISDNNKKKFIWSTIYLAITFFALTFIFKFSFSGINYLQLKHPASYLLLSMPFFIALMIFLLSYLIMVAFSRFFTSRAGGVNGDIVGATSQIIEIFYLFITSILLTIF